DRESRMAIALDEHDAQVPTPENERRQRAAEARARDYDVGVDPLDRLDVRHYRPVFTGLLVLGPAAESALTGHEGEHALCEIHRVKSIAPRDKTRRACREALEIPQIHEQPATANRPLEGRVDGFLHFVERRLPERPRCR